MPEKRGGVHKIVLLVSLSFLILITLSTSVLAAKVAYFYSKSFRIDDNIIDTFEDFGLDVDLIQEDAIPSDLSEYDLIYIGDERFDNIDQIPVEDFPSIISNYYHGEELGLTDAEGISQIGANYPLSVRYNGRTVQVYTRAFLRGTIAIPYYFLDKENKASDLRQIAGTETTSSGVGFGDVISYGDAGSRLQNGEVIVSNTCFFGLVESDYWTESTKDLFRDCVSFVVSQCDSDLDCPADRNSDPFCQDGNVYIHSETFSCEKPDEIVSQCLLSESNVLIEECDLGCFEGACIQPSCSSDLDCPSPIVSDPFCSNLDVEQTVTSYTCINPGTDSSFCEESTSTETLEMCSESCSSGECIDLECISDSECGSIETERFCSNLDVVERSVIPQCLENSCSSEVIEEVIETCSDSCTNGSCQVFDCSEDSDCSDNDPLTKDICVNPGSNSASCENIEINCASDLDCGFTGFLGIEFCSQSSVFKNFRNSTCINPGTLDSHCSVDIFPREIQQCQFACSEGSCISCDSNSDCDDSDPLTSDICVNPGSAEARCENNPIPLECSDDSDCDDSDPLTYDECLHPDTLSAECRNTEINCASNLDCGGSYYLGSTYCSESDIYQNFYDGTCINPGSTYSFCISQVTSELKQSCSESCSLGSCEGTQTCDSEAAIKIDFIDIQNNASGNLEPRVFVGSSEEYGSNESIPLTSSGEFISDEAIREDIPGISVQRINGTIRFMLFGSQTISDKEYLEALITFENSSVVSFHNDFSNATTGGKPNMIGSPMDSFHFVLNSTSDEVKISEDSTRVTWYSTVSNENDAFFLNISCTN